MLPFKLSRSMLLFLLLLGLSACASPREKSQALAEEIVKQLPVPEGAKLLYMEKVEGLAKQGVGTHFGVTALYGSDEEYSHLVEQYQALLSTQGWENFGRTDTWYCNSDYEGVRIEVGESIVFENSAAADIISTAKATYQTLYVLDVLQFPFDDIGGCEGKD